MPSFSETSATDPIRLIDVLLMDTFLFVMDVRHDKQLVRDEAFFCWEGALVEEAKSRLDSMKASDDFVSHEQYAQCGLLDHTVMNTAPEADDRVWRRAPLEGAFLGTLRAGEIIPDNLRKLLRQEAPDGRLLVLYQRIYAFGFCRFLTGYENEHRQAMESLDVLVHAAEQPQSAPLIVECLPGVRRGLLRSRLFHVMVLTALVITLYCGLDYLLHHCLLASLSG
ncbi:DotU family type IV/VI secretion system protein [Pantoea sp. GD03673]|uniref:DotU family type IV/VI secretion system protein n=1 Tax=Pantoea sp. GD03673 TaxID=2975364 RepID=UPI00244C9985|nr:DotU family type IV/VI secretion system protein [Pantoea sp. GD03673]MDH2067455.1 DotU family type IV/VI secretion system protein [Pantoea sp. GD03673]